MTRSSLRPVLAAKARALMRLSRLIRRVAHQRFDGGHDIGIGRLPQCGKKGLRFSHEKAYAETHGDGIGLSMHAGSAAGDRGCVPATSDVWPACQRCDKMTAEHAPRRRRSRRNHEHAFHRTSWKDSPPPNRCFRRRFPCSRFRATSSCLRPQTRKQREFEARVKEMGAQMAKRLGMSRRRFFQTAAGMATAFLAMNDTYGPIFGVSRAEAAEPGTRRRSREEALRPVHHGHAHALPAPGHADP